MQVITLKNHRYGSKHFAVGNKYEIKSQSVLRLHKALGWVADLPEELKVQKPVPTAVKSTWVKPVQAVETKTELEDASDSTTTTKGKYKKSTYKRKDMTVVDE